MGLWTDIVGSVRGYIRLGLTGVRLKNSSGALAVRNAGDSADAALSCAALTLSGKVTFATGADIASATTVDLTAATGNLVRVTGTTATTGVTINNGQVVLCYPTGAWPLTYHATNMPIKGGVSYTCAAGDTVIFSKDGNGTLHVDIFKADGTALVVTAAGVTSGTVVDTSTGATSYTKTGIPSGAKFISFGFGGISTNGTSSVMMRVGPSGGVVSTGYVGTLFDNTTATQPTDGFYIDNFGAAAAVRHGRATLQLIDAATNTWSWRSNVLSSDSNRAERTSSGTISLAGALERFQLIANGTDTFDAGKLNYLYWE